MDLNADDCAVLDFVEFVFFGGPENEEQAVLEFFVHGGDFFQHGDQLEMRFLAQSDFESVDFFQVSFGVIIVQDELNELEVVFEQVEIGFEDFGQFGLFQNLHQLSVRMVEAEKEFPVDFGE